MIWASGFRLWDEELRIWEFEVVQVIGFLNGGSLLWTFVRPDSPLAIDGDVHEELG